MLEVQGVTKDYLTPAGPLRVLGGIDFSLDSGESAAIVGPSGSGKSTLLYILGALEPPTTGKVCLDGKNPFELNDAALAEFRNGQVGFVFQDHLLLPQCTVLENVLIPTLVARDGEERVQQRAVELLDRVGLAHRLRHRPHELSGGEKQRVVLARALVRGPRLILCDEPTGNLDHESADNVAGMLLQLHGQEQNILVVVTHNLELAKRFDRRYRLTDARMHPV